MSLTLDCGTNPPGLRTKTFNDFVQIGEYNLSLHDFLILAEYVLTNTDLAENDPRLPFIAKVSEFSIVKGWSNGHQKIVIPER